MNSGVASSCCPVYTEVPLSYAGRLGNSANAIILLQPCFDLDLRSLRDARIIFRPIILAGGGCSRPLFGGLRCSWMWTSFHAVDFVPSGRAMPA
jgi:hypothetical protein